MFCMFLSGYFLTTKKNQSYDWIAVVKKNNKWILKLILYLGYRYVDKSDETYNVIKKNFLK